MLSIFVSVAWIDTLNIWILFVILDKVTNTIFTISPTFLDLRNKFLISIELSGHVTEVFYVFSEKNDVIQYYYLFTVSIIIDNDVISPWQGKVCIHRRQCHANSLT